MGLTGINWVGHIYQKYETMLLEVEEDMYQDVVNYVENQVQTVGDSVKKFYSDVMEDLLPPPSADPLSADVCDYKMTKVGTKKKPLNVTPDKVMEIPKEVYMEVENRAPSFHGLSSVNSSPAPSSSDHLNGSYSELYSTPYEDASMHENQEAPSEETKYESDGSVDGPSNKKTEVRLSSCGASLADSNDMSSSHNRESIVRSLTDGNRRCCDPDISGKTVDEVIVFNLGEGDATASNEKMIQQGNRLKLDETCVMVNGDEAHFTSQRKGKGRPSKKKIRDALSLRRKPARAREYEQIAVWYECDGESESLKRMENMEDNGSSETGHIFESEWELL